MIPCLLVNRYRLLGGSKSIIVIYESGWRSTALLGNCDVSDGVKSQQTCVSTYLNLRRSCIWEFNKEFFPLRNIPHWAVASCLSRLQNHTQTHNTRKILLTVHRNISIIVPARCTICFQFITTNDLYMFTALICSSSGFTVYTTVGMFCVRIMSAGCQQGTPL
jgi:hypothetical protein